ncbi:MAG: hypothetical protein HOO96_31250 [Polyangiaceae bacterium]|nr:hypothetical protein [Polyangiaceae bacterium]
MKRWLRAGLLVGAGCSLGDRAPAPDHRNAGLSGRSGGASLVVADVLPARAATPAAALTAGVAAAPTPVSLDVAFAGDVIPHDAIVRGELATMVARLPQSYWSADARVLNLEAAIGEVPRGADPRLLRFYAPKAWASGLVAATKVGTVVAANNHGCDRDAEGLGDTLTALGDAHATAAGLSAADPWAPVQIAEKSGKRVCLVAWTAFVNDRKYRPETCGAKTAAASLAVAPLGADGLTILRRELGRPDRFASCDATVAYVHAGTEYHAQTPGALAQGRLAACYVDAVVFSHPHVPDRLTTFERSRHCPAGRSGSVPVFQSLGNLLGHQGASWAPGKSVRLEEAGEPLKPYELVWTRVGALGLLHFVFGAGAPEITARQELVFAEYDGPATSLRPLVASPTDPVYRSLKQAPAALRELLPAPVQ